jgi:hypothetical protein
MEQWIGTSNRSRSGKMNVLIIWYKRWIREGAMDGAGDKRVSNECYNLIKRKSDGSWSKL